MRVVVSLSTIPSRVDRLGEVVMRLLSQTRVPDRIYINLPVVSRRQGVKYPDVPASCRHPLVMINRCDDLGPLTKLAPTLRHETLPDTLIITVDDDIAYQNTRIQDLVDAATRRPDAAIGGTGFILGEWWRFYGTVKTPEQDTPVDVIEGYSACAYRRRFFGATISPPIDAPPSLFYHDDILISGSLARLGVPRIVHSAPRVSTLGNSGYGHDIKTDDGLSSDTIKFVLQMIPAARYYQKEGSFDRPQTVGMNKTFVGLLVLVLVFILLFVVAYTIRY